MNPGDWARRIPDGLRSRISASPTLRRVLPNTGWLLVDKLARLVVGVLVGAWVARHLGPTDYGMLNFAMAWVAIFTPLTTLAHERIVVRDLVERPERSASLLGSAMGLRLLAGLAAYLAVVLAIARLRPHDPVMLGLVTVVGAAMVLQGFGVIELWFQSRVRSRDVVLALVAAILAAAVFRVALILTHAPLQAFAWAWLVEAMLVSLALVLVYQRQGRSLISWRVDGACVRALIRDSWPLTLSGVMILIYMRIDQIMLGQLSTGAELGAYSAAVKVVEAWYFLPTAVVASFLPAIVEARQQDESVFYARLQKLYGIMAAAGYAIALPVSLLSGWIVATLYGPSYERAAPMLAVLVWSLLFTNLGIARGAFLTSMNWTRPYLLTVALGGIVNVGLNLALIPRWGGMGAVISTCVAYWVATHGACFTYRPLFRTGRMLTRAMLLPRF